VGPQVSFLPDGRRLHLHHGPIDLIIDATGPGRDAGLNRATIRFETILQELASELDLLRRPLSGPADCHGTVARAMQYAIAPYSDQFVTPMAAVAGAVADEILRAICAEQGLRTVHVNNGGDVAFHLAAGETLTAAVAAVQSTRITFHSDDPVRGIATSGWRGRSHSLGIADSVTVLARSAAQADVAATLIANAVDLPGHPGITRAPANRLSPDSDLGARMVTVDVAGLSPQDTDAALDRGERFARLCLARGHITGAYLSLNGAHRFVGARKFLKSAPEEATDARLCHPQDHDLCRGHSP